MKTKNKELQRVVVTLYLRLRKARRDLAMYQLKDSSWSAMKDQARGSHFEAFMAFKEVRKITR